MFSVCFRLLLCMRVNHTHCAPLLLGARRTLASERRWRICNSIRLPLLRLLYRSSLSHIIFHKFNEIISLFISSLTLSLSDTTDLLSIGSSHPSARRRKRRRRLLHFSSSFFLFIFLFLINFLWYKYSLILSHEITAHLGGLYSLLERNATSETERTSYYNIKTRHKPKIFSKTKR